ncbi:hypothetical protein [Flagellimonas pacifica]|uniref:Lipoprotein n=1 Tax=Flagellimonas pacifica TaxID=1247520 RepID=A0A285MXV3_9FLAO|nr:hypothetical protein [Allomuricauda parva]SNZ01918.1 hypothetical protein SAMN06265377_3769 [Allomuricauda parva]
MEKEIPIKIGNQKEEFNNFKMISFLLFTIIFTISCGFNDAKKDKTEQFKILRTKKVDEASDFHGNNLMSNSRVQTDTLTKIDTIEAIDTLKLYNKRLIGKIILPSNTWYLLSGKSCEQCDENISIYLFPKNREILSLENEINYDDRFGYPGKVYSYEDNTLIYESSTFFGKCLQGFGDVVVWIDRSIDESGEWIEGVYLIQILEDKAAESRPELSYSLLEEIDKNIGEGMCFEIEEIDQVSEP